MARLASSRQLQLLLLVCCGAAAAVAAAAAAAAPAPTPTAKPAQQPPPPPPPQQPQACTVVGDAACACHSVGGAWLATPTTLRPVCRKALSSGGRQRLVDLYFPVDVNAPGVRYSPWVHLHGVNLAAWFYEKNPAWRSVNAPSSSSPGAPWPPPLGGSLDASRMGVLTGAPLDPSTATATNSSSSGSGSSGSSGGGLVREPGVVLVVPHATGDPERGGQMWQALFWPCFAAIGRCVDASIDDVGFVADVVAAAADGRLLQVLSPSSSSSSSPAAGKVALVSGYSNGGMMAQALLCARPELAAKIGSVALLWTIMGSDFSAARCQARLPAALPVLWAHGTADATLPYAAGTSEGVKVLGAEGGTRFWAGKMGCAGAAGGGGGGGTGRQLFDDASLNVSCVDVCQTSSGGATTASATARAPAAAAAAAGQKQQQVVPHAPAPPVVLCTVRGVGHAAWDSPRPGFAAGLARWARGGFAGQPTAFRRRA